MEHSLNAINVDPIPIHHGATTRAVVVPIVVFIISGIFKLPNEFSGTRMEAAQLRPIVVTVKLIEPASADTWHAVAGSHRFLPDELQTFGRPRIDDPLFRGDAGAKWT